MAEYNYEEIKSLIDKNEKAKMQYESKKNKMLARIDVLVEELEKLELSTDEKKTLISEMLHVDKGIITKEFLNNELSRLINEFKSNTNEYKKLITKLEEVDF